MAAVLEFRLTGGSDNTDPNASLGGAMSSTTITSGQLNNLFDDVQPDEASSGDSEYRAIDVYNSGDAEAVSVSLYISSENNQYPDIKLDLGYDTVLGARDPSNDGTSPPPSIADEDTAPNDAGGNPISFDHYDSDSPLSLPNIPVGYAVRVWVRRDVTAGTGNIASDSATLTVKYA